MNLNDAYFPSLLKNSRVLFARLLGSGYHSLSGSFRYFGGKAAIKMAAQTQSSILWKG